MIRQKKAGALGKALVAAIGAIATVSCSDSGSDPAPSPVATPAPTPAPSPAPAPTPPPGGTTQPETIVAFASVESTGRFVTQATFGPTETDLTDLTGTSASEWYRAELTKAPSLALPYVQAFIAEDELNNPNQDFSFPASNSPGMAFWRNAVTGDDQLRQRMAFALSQILVVSSADDELFGLPETVAHYMDILTRNAFGNYRDLLEEVTYSPAMGIYLTYLQNQAGDPFTGRVPDENYAREIMQLFTIGLVQLDANGDPVLGADGESIETYTNDDITGLARVFTGLSFGGPEFFFDFSTLDEDALFSSMEIFPEFHSDLEKSFLGTTIPANTDAATSIDQALDTLFNHPNMGPFLARQLIQRFVTSDPASAYVGRVANAFETGTFTLPDGVAVGTGERGDLTATLAAVLFDEDARRDPAQQPNTFGKVREPIMRFVHWARAFDATTVTPEFTLGLWDTSGSGELLQHPYRSPSVFNFYRPGYVAPGTESGAAGLTVPELQLVNASSIVGYVNFLSFFGFELQQFAVDNDLVDAVDAVSSFRPDYSEEIALADDPANLVDHLDERLLYGRLRTESRQGMIDVISLIPLENEFDPNYDGPRLRAQVAVVMAMTTPDYLVQH
ncbi:MAG: DUF1800 domain-containing protein [Pseudomonadota bacterium]